MFRTIFLTALMVLAAYGGTVWLTHDFQVWTAEGARRLEVALNPVATPNVSVDGPGIPPQPLVDWLTGAQTITVLDFAYTRCLTVCLALGSTYQQMQASLMATHASDPAAHRVKLLTVSFDGQHDSPNVLNAYAARLGADQAFWSFLRTTSPADTRRLLDAFAVTVVADGRSDFQHNAALLVIDAQARLVRVFDYSEHVMALAYARHLANQLPSHSADRAPP